MNGFHQCLHQLQILQPRRALNAAAGIQACGPQPLLRQLLKGLAGIAGAEPAGGRDGAAARPGGDGVRARLGGDAPRVLRFVGRGKAVLVYFMG